MSVSRFAPPAEVPGLAARRIAADILDGVLHKRRTLDDQLDGAAAHIGLRTLADRDRALMRRLVATALRRLGTLRHVLSRLLDRGLPGDAPRAQSALLIGASRLPLAGLDRWSTAIAGASLVLCGAGIQFLGL